MKNKNLNAQLSSKTDNWSTPKWLLKELEKTFGKFDYDPCPLDNNYNNTLFDDWKGNVFVNPPYSNVKEFLNKALLEIKKGNCKQAIFLIIPRTSTKYWRDYVMKYATRIYFFDKRLKFGDSKSSAPFPSCVVVFRDLNKNEYTPCYTWSLENADLSQIKKEE